MKKRQRLKSVSLAGPGGTIQTHDRRTTDLLLNARVAAVQVDDPLEKGAKLIVLRSLRDDPLGALFSADQVEHYQYTAGRRWQGSFELSQGCGCKAIDPAKEFVDGGQIAQATLTERQIEAQQDISDARKALGMEGESIVMDVLGRGLTLTQAGAKRGLFSEAERKYLGRRFRETLHTMAIVFGYTTEK